MSDMTATSPKGPNAETDVQFGLIQRFSGYLAENDRSRIRRQIDQQTNEAQKQGVFYRYISGLIKVAGETKDETYGRNCTNKALGIFSSFKKEIDVKFSWSCRWMDVFAFSMLF